MNEYVNKYSFVTALKASNIEGNITSLDGYSTQISLYLNELQPGDNHVLEENIKASQSAIEKSKKEDDPIKKLAEYVKLGNQLLFIIKENGKESNYTKTLKKIASIYLDIAKLIGDETVTKLSFSIADQLIGN